MVDTVGAEVTRTLARSAAALLSGLAIWASFPPLSWWPVGILGVAGLAVTVRSAPSWKSTAALGFLAGLGLWVPMMSFLRGGCGIAAWSAEGVRCSQR